MALMVQFMPRELRKRIARDFDQFGFDTDTLVYWNNRFCRAADWLSEDNVLGRRAK